MNRRTVPPELGRILTEYLAIIRPAEIYFSSKFNCNGLDDLDNFLWADYKKGVWSGEYLSDLLKAQTSKHGMPALGFRDYRQVAVAFMEKHLKHKGDGLVWEGEESIYDIQGGHTGRTVGRNYAVAFGDSGVVPREVWHKHDLASKAWSGFLLEKKADPTQGIFD